MADITGMSLGISAICEDTIVNALPTRFHAENTNGTNKGWNKSVTSTNIRGYPEKMPNEDTKQHTATIHVGGLNSKGTKNNKLIHMLAARLYLLSNTCFNSTADMPEDKVENPIEMLLIKMLPPIYFVYIINI